MSTKAAPTLPADLTVATPGEIDTAAAAIYTARLKAERYAESCMDSLHDATGDRGLGGYRGPKSYKRTHEETIALAEKAIAEKQDGYYHRIAETLQEWRQKVAEIATYRDMADQISAEFERRDGWSRFFLVTNHGGHIHRSMDCSTCNKNGSWTDFAWLPELSGQSDEEAVAAHGAILCTTCYPAAPVHWTNAHEVAAQARKATQCPGSGTFYDAKLPHRKGYCSGNWATCPTCKQGITLTSGDKLRTHKPPKA